MSTWSFHRLVISSTHTKIFFMWEKELSRFEDMSLINQGRKIGLKLGIREVVSSTFNFIDKHFFLFGIGD